MFDHLCFLLAKAEQKHHMYTKRILGQLGLPITPGQLPILYSLLQGDGIPITELGKKVLLDNSTLTGLIDRLERLNLVERREAREDRRICCIYLTPAARDLEPLLNEAIRTVSGKLAEGLTPDEAVLLRRALRRIFDNL